MQAKVTHLNNKHMTNIEEKKSHAIRNQLFHSQTNYTCSFVKSRKFILTYKSTREEKGKVKLGYIIVRSKA